MQVRETFARHKPGRESSSGERARKQNSRVTRFVMRNMKTIGLAAVLLAGVATAAAATDLIDGVDPHTDPSFDVQKELNTNFFTQLAANDGKCFVDRIRKEWEAAGKPKVKGWAEEVTDDEAEAAYRCVFNKITTAYAKSDEDGAKEFGGWKRYNTGAYPSDTHGGRMVNNYANAVAVNYGKFEEFGSMPVGSVLVKDSFGVNKRGEVRVGPLFTMVKKEAGFNEASADWQYVLITPKGKTIGATGGANAKKVNFCIKCHESAADWDQMFFLPDDYRVQ